MAERPIAKDEADDHLCFSTAQGKPVWLEITSEKATTFFRDSSYKGIHGSLCRPATSHARSVDSTASDARLRRSQAT